jgi:hypothetical protein
VLPPLVSAYVTVTALYILNASLGAASAGQKVCWSTGLLPVVQWLSCIQSQRQAANKKLTAQH